MVNKLLKGNKEFREKIFGPEHLERFTKGQHPQTLWIGCSDSRVPESLLTGAGDGELFVHRNVANLIPEHQSETGATLEYAVEHLKVKEIIICGHYGCGGLTTLLHGVDHRTHIGHWLRNAEQALQHLERKHDFADLPEEEKLNLLVEENLRVQRSHAMSYPFVREAVKNGDLKIHLLIYELDTGVLKELEQ